MVTYKLDTDPIRKFSIDPMKLQNPAEFSLKGSAHACGIGPVSSAHILLIRPKSADAVFGGRRFRVLLSGGHSHLFVHNGSRR